MARRNANVATVATGEQERAHCVGNARARPDSNLATLPRSQVGYSNIENTGNQEGTHRRLLRRSRIDGKTGQTGVGKAWQEQRAEKLATLMRAPTSEFHQGLQAKA